MNWLEDLLVPLIAVVTLPIGILLFVMGAGELAIATFVIGWFLLVPVLAILGDTLSSERDESTTEDDPLEVLRERYAKGEISESEFERQVEKLLATEDVDVGDASAIEDVLDSNDESVDRSYDLERSRR
ncbi:MAG TPA: SHOCT domain-containing protein [Natrialbaceae archaeon]|nr:SHOCT domain-containing protein [Natrialbaceae archaeon]